jgi:hypothetical protein
MEDVKSYVVDECQAAKHARLHSSKPYTEYRVSCIYMVARPMQTRSDISCGVCNICNQFYLDGKHTALDFDCSKGGLVHTCLCEIRAMPR